MSARAGERMMHREVMVPRPSLVAIPDNSSEPKQAFGSGRRGRLAWSDCDWILLRSPPLASLLLFVMR